MIEFICPHCEHKMDLPDEFAGHRSTCTRCGIPFETPGPGRGGAPGAGPGAGPGGGPGGGPSGRPGMAVEDEPSTEDIWADLHGGRAKAAQAKASVKTRGGAQRDGPEFPDWIEDRARLSGDRLSPLFWAAAYFMPPVALFWGLSLPRRHPQKKIAIILPCVWFAILSSVGVVTTYILPQLLEEEQAAGDSQPVATQMSIADAGVEAISLPATNASARLDVTKLQVGEIYRVMERDVALRYQPGEGTGIGGLSNYYKLPIGGIFQIVYIETINRRPWYQVIVTDGKQSYYMWIFYRDLVHAGLTPVAPATFSNPQALTSTPITRLW